MTLEEAKKLIEEKPGEERGPAEAGDHDHEDPRPPEHRQALRALRGPQEHIPGPSAHASFLSV